MKYPDEQWPGEDISRTVNQIATIFSGNVQVLLKVVMNYGKQMLTYIFLPMIIFLDTIVFSFCHVTSMNSHWRTVESTKKMVVHYLP